MEFNRRQLFKSSLAGAAVGAREAFAKKDSQWDLPRDGFPFGGKIVGEDVAFGHKVKEVLNQNFQNKQSVTQIETLVLGGGISGLSSGWRFLGESYTDFAIIEHNTKVGGKSIGGENAISHYPWGAHYLPFPSSDAAAARRLLLEMGVAQKGNDGLLKYDPRHVCFSPHERLFWNGEWISGLKPPLTQLQKNEFSKFDELVLNETNIGDIKNPVFKSKWNERTRKLDNMSASHFLKKHGLLSKELQWFCEYATRDDFGLALDKTSAWALMHYFVGRNAPEGEGDLVWPEGNYRVVKYLEGKLEKFIKSGRLLLRIEKKNKFYYSYVFNIEKTAIEVYKSRFIVYALPKFQLPFHHNSIDIGWEKSFSNYTYSPWVVANITLKGNPVSKGTELSWDNVYFKSNSLGYVVSTHQSLNAWKQGTVLTWYRPITEWDARQGRHFLLKSDWKYWVKEILRDLQPSHKNIISQIQQIDVMRWGHAMAAPTPGLLSQVPHLKLIKEGFALAHADLSAMSLFEEAQYHGVRGAEDILRESIGSKLTDSWL